MDRSLLGCQARRALQRRLLRRRLSTAQAHAGERWHLPPRYAARLPMPLSASHPAVLMSVWCDDLCAVSARLPRS
eukprot:5656794-Pleurochrysis_carterae.AAC.1